MSPFRLLICAVLVFVSAYLSASEIALFSLSRFQLRALKERFRNVHRQIKRLLSDPGGLLITILVINEIVNISLSTLITEAISRQSKEPYPLLVPLTWLPSWAIDTVLGILVTAPIVLFLCEITPKVVAARVNQLVATLTVGPVTLIYEFMRPVRQVLKRFVTLVARRVVKEPTAALEKERAKELQNEKILRESDFLLMVEEGHREGAIQESELELIRNVFELDDTAVSEVYTPLTQVHCLPLSTNLKTALQSMRGQKFSRIPILSANRRNVEGILYTKDLLRAKLEPELLGLNVAAIMRKPFFVSTGTRLNALFRKLKQNKTHMAVVQDASGHAIGVVTMSDLLDAVFEDIFPDEDED